MSTEYVEKAALLAQVRESRANNIHLDSRDRHAHDTEHRHFEYMIFTAKPADVVPVVRCKDCKHSNYTGTSYLCDKHSGHKDVLGEDERYYEYHYSGWFCADGERRVNE